MDEKFDLRVLVKHCWKRKLKPTETVNEICSGESSTALCFSTIKRWFDRFYLGYLRLEDNERSGRPDLINLHKIIEKVETNPQTSTEDFLMN